MSRVWIIGYDITDPRRLGRVHRAMVNRATPIEYSIFLFIGDERQVAECLAAVDTLIDGKTDDVRCYPFGTSLDRQRRSVPKTSVSRWMALRRRRSCSPWHQGIQGQEGQGEERAAL